MPVCHHCGAELQDTQKFCGACGYPQQGDIPFLTWTGRINYVKNPLVYRFYLILLVISVISGILLSLFLGSVVGILLVLVAVGLIFLFIIGSLIWESATGGGDEIRGIVSPEGVAHQMGDTIRTVNRGYLLGGILALLGGSGSGATILGGGLIAASQENNAIPWSGIRSVKVYPSNRLIVVKDVTMISPVVLYCTEENFELVRDIVQKHIPAGVTMS